LCGGSTCSPGADDEEENPADEQDEPHADQPVDHDGDRRGQGGHPDAASSSFVSRFRFVCWGPTRPSTPFGGWASAIVLWGFAAYRFQCRAVRRLGHHHLLGRPPALTLSGVALPAGLIGMAISPTAQAVTFPV
jgi:hypothetical protein